MSGVKEAERELAKVEETIAMADRAIQISRQEHERLSTELIAVAEQLDLRVPAVDET